MSGLDILFLMNLLEGCNDVDWDGPRLEVDNFSVDLVRILSHVK